MKALIKIKEHNELGNYIHHKLVDIVPCTFPSEWIINNIILKMYPDGNPTIRENGIIDFYNGEITLILENYCEINNIQFNFLKNLIIN